MNKCKYCKTLLKKSEGNSWNVCSCDKAQKDWDINIKIQIIEKELINLKKQLKNLYKK